MKSCGENDRGADGHAQRVSYLNSCDENDRGRMVTPKGDHR